MVQDITLSDFHNAFRHAGRYDEFGYEGLTALYEYLEEVGDGAGQPYNLDVIGLSCEYSVDTPGDIADAYAIDIDGLDEEAIARAVPQWLNEHTSIIAELDNGSILYCSEF